MFEIARDYVAQTKQRVFDPKKESFLLLELADAIFSIPRIQALIDDRQNPASDANIKAFLRQRWALIATGPLCYTHNPEYPLNLACAALCEGKNTLLMPSVQSQDFYLDELDKQELGTFMISDDRTSFILLGALVDTAIDKIEHSRKPIYIYGDNVVVTQKELERTGDVYRKLEKICRLSEENDSEKSLYTELVKLRNGLEQGDVKHKGREHVGGDDAFVALVNFQSYYNDLTEAGKQEIRALQCGNLSMGTELDALREVQNNGTRTGVNYCLGTIGSHVGMIITANEARLRVFNGKAEIADLKRALQSCVKYDKPILTEKIFYSPWQEQLSAVETAIKINLKLKTERSMFLFRLIQFILAECVRVVDPERKEASKREYEEKLDYFLNLLRAVGYETFDFNQRSCADNILVLRESIDRLNYLMHFSEASKARWMAWCNDNRESLKACYGKIQLFGHKTKLLEYKLYYPSESLNESKVIIELRSEIREQKRLAESQASDNSGVDAFAELMDLATESTATRLLFHRKKFSALHVKQLQDFLRENTTLCELDLSSCMSQSTEALNTLLLPVITANHSIKKYTPPTSLDDMRVVLQQLGDSDEAMKKELQKNIQDGVAIQRIMDRNAQNPKLFDAVRRNDLGAVKKFVEAKVDLKILDSTECTLLHFAPSSEMVEFLVRRGGLDVNAVDHKQCTPLHHAAMGNKTSVVNALLNFPADPLARDSAGKMPVEYGAREILLDIQRNALESIRKSLCIKTTTTENFLKALQKLNIYNVEDVESVLKKSSEEGQTVLSLILNKRENDLSDFPTIQKAAEKIGSLPSVVDIMVAHAQKRTPWSVLKAEPQSPLVNSSAPSN